MKKLIAVFLVLLLMTGCGGSTSASVVLGFNLELSGAVADYGQMIQKGADLAVELANKDGGVLDQEVSVVTVDNQSVLEEVVSAATKLATVDNVVGIIGPATSGNSAASFEVASQYTTVNVSPSATADGVTKAADDSLLEYGFTLSFQDSYQGSVMAKFASDNLGASKAVVFADNSSDYAVGLSDNFKSYFEDNGGSIVSTEAYTAGETDFNAVLTKIKSLDFDVLFVPGYYAEVGLIVKQARAMGITQPILGGDGYDSPELINLAGADSLNDVYYATGFNVQSTDEDVKTFVEAYTEKYGDAPSSFAALAYDSVNILIEAINSAGGVDKEAVKNALAAVKDFDGVTGSISMSEEHTPIKTVVVVKLENGQQASAVEIQP